SWLVVITVSVGLVISLTVRDVLTVMSASAFWAAAGIVPVIVFAYFLQACADFFNFGILHKGETQHIAYGTLLSVIVIIAFSFLLIPRFGGAGAAWATLLSFAVRLAYFYHASQRLFPIKFLLGRPIGTVAVAVTVYLVYWAALQWVPILKEVFWSLGIAGVSIVLFLAVITKLSLISPEDQKAIAGFLKSPIKVWGEIRGSSA
ncbi:MAG: oligosaccharide flippase family protein, partial [Nitrospiria bacterium]